MGGCDEGRCRAGHAVYKGVRLPHVKQAGRGCVGAVAWEMLSAQEAHSSVLGCLMGVEKTEDRHVNEPSLSPAGRGHSSLV